MEKIYKYPIVGIFSLINHCILATIKTIKYKFMKTVFTLFLLIISAANLSAQKDYYSSYELLILQGKRNFDKMLGAEMSERIGKDRADLYYQSSVRDLDEDQKYFALLKIGKDIMHVSKYKSTNPHYKEVLRDMKSLFMKIQLPRVRILDYKSSGSTYQTLVSSTEKYILTMGVDEVTKELEIWVFANWDQPK